MSRFKPTLALSRMNEFTHRPVAWLWDQRLALGKLAIIAGDPGLGKSFMTLDLAARVSRDGVMPDGFRGPCGDVMLISAEDDPSDTLLPRLHAARADLDRVHFVRGVSAPGNGRAAGRDDGDARGDGAPRAGGAPPGEAPPGAFVLNQLGPLRRAMEAVRPRLIIIDPITAYLGECDSNNNAQVRALLAPLSQLAAEFECCVIAVSHLNKAADGAGSKAMYRTMGSLAFVAAARSAWLVSRRKGQADARIFAQVKNNLGRERRAICFRVVDEADTGRVEWDPTEIDVTADDAAEDRVTLPGRPDAQRQRAATFLRERLAAGPTLYAELAAGAQSIGVNDRTLRRAGEALGVTSAPSGDRDHRTTWSIAPDPHATDEPS